MVFKVCALYSHPFLKCPKLTECITHSYVELSFDSFQTSELYESLPPTSSSTSLQTPLRLAPHLVNVGRALTRAIRSRIVSRIMAQSGKRIVRGTLSQVARGEEAGLRERSMSSSSNSSHVGGTKLTQPLPS
jgi:hypothetical protein